MIEYIKTNWLQLAMAAYAILNIVNGLLPANEQNKLHVIMDALAFLTRSDSPGTIKLPLVQASGAPGAK